MPYMIYAYIGVVWGVNVGIYGIHGVYGCCSVHSSQRDLLFFSVDLIVPEGLDTPSTM